MATIECLELNVTTNSEYDETPSKPYGIIVDIEQIEPIIAPYRKLMQKDTCINNMHVKWPESVPFKFAYEDADECDDSVIQVVDGVEYNVTESDEDTWNFPALKFERDDVGKPYVTFVMYAECAEAWAFLSLD